MTHRSLHYLLLFVWAGEVTALAVGELLPGSMLQFRHMPNDKLLHFGGYFVAAALAPAAFESRLRASLVSMGLVLFGVLLEFIQRFVPGRTFSLADMAANTAGVLLGLTLGLGLRVVLIQIINRIERGGASHPIS